MISRKKGGYLVCKVAAFVGAMKSWFSSVLLCQKYPSHPEMEQW